MSNIQGIKRTLLQLDAKLKSDEMRAHFLAAQYETDIKEELKRWEDSEIGDHVLFVLPLFDFSATTEFKKSSTKHLAEHMSRLGLLI